MKVKEVQLNSSVLTESTETALCWSPLRRPHPPSEGALVLWAWSCSSTYSRRSISIRVQFLSISLYFPEFPLLREPYSGGHWDFKGYMMHGAVGCAELPRLSDEWAAERRDGLWSYFITRENKEKYMKSHSCIDLLAYGQQSVILIHFF